MATATRMGPSARSKIKAPATFESKSRLGWIPINKTFSDPNYQRAVDLNRVRAMAANFDPDAIGSILVSKRASGEHSGEYAVFDGYHRVSVFRLLGWDDQKIPAVIYEGLTEQEEALLFEKVNKDRTKPKPLALFKARVAGGDKDATDLAQVMTNLGLAYDTYSQIKGGIRAIDTIQKVHRVCGITTVRRALTVMTQAWGHDSESLNGEVFKGVALFLYHYGAKVDISNLANKLKEKDSQEIKLRSKQMKDIMPEWQMPSCVAAIIVQIYNHRLRNDNRLPAWEGHGFPRKSMQRGK